MAKSVSTLSRRSVPREVNDRAPAKSKSDHLPRWGRLGLRLKAMIVAIAMSTLPVLAIGTAAYLELSYLSELEIKELEHISAANLQTQLNQLMAERYGDIQIMAELDILTNSKERQNASPAAIATVLNRFQKAYPLYDSIAVFDLNGDVIAQTKGKPIGNHRDRPYIQEALRTKGAVIGQPSISSSSGSFTVKAAAAIKDRETGNVIGTIRASVPVERLISLVRILDEHDHDEEEWNSSHYLINANGEIFYGPEGEYVNKANGKDSKDSPAAAEQYSAKPIEAIFPEVASLRATQEPGSQIVRNQATKVEQLVTYVPPITSEGLDKLKWKPPNLNWSVVLARDTSVAFAERNQLLFTLVTGGGVTMLLAAAIAIYLANRAVRPILASAQTVEKIGQGELGMRVSVQGTDELATLGTNINHMADQIQSLLHTLRQNAIQTKQQTDVLFNLSQNEALIQGNAKAAALCFTEAIAQTLNLERVGIWLFNNERTRLTCFDQYDGNLFQHSSDDVLWSQDLPDFFQALESTPVIAVERANADLRTQSLVQTEQVLSDTAALLCLSIRISSQLVGVIWCEHTDPSRVWQADEQSFVSAIASLTAIVLESDSVQQEVGQFLEVVSEAEEGNLAIQAQVGNRMVSLAADTFNRLLERLAQVLHQVVDAAHQVAEKTNQQKALVQTVATNAQQQAQSVAQVLQLTERVEQAAQESAQDVQASSTSLQLTSKAVTDGQVAIDALNQEIATLQEGTDRMMQRMKTLGEFVGLADQFVQDQSQIAFVTQTLAMNASLVAARASEQQDPRQFIVVAREFDSIADQVSKLAQQTSEGLVAIEQRSTQIHQVVAAVDADVQGFGELVQHVMHGVEQSNQVFNQVQTVMKTAVQVGGTVADSSQNIVTAAQSTAAAMRDIAELANRTTHLTQQTKSQFEQVDELSNQLLQSVQFFRLPAAPEKGSSDHPNGASRSQPVALTTVVDDVLSKPRSARNL
ncbi:MAG: HAMP domain-containing protein [Leptolyngbyaceae cyanobacterium RU_5_1]|nr:HAMP domain-containing protein [Leptolyngbyaceae cyanobacterium RU_5_1]